MCYANVYLNYYEVYFIKLYSKVSLHLGDNGKSQKDFRQGVDIIRDNIFES